MADGKVVIGTEIDESGAKKGMSNLKSNMKKWGSSFGKIGSAALKGTAVAVTAVGTAISGASVAAIKFGSDFESQMSRVKAISGATSEEFTLLSEKAKEMGAKTKFSATESAKAMEYMAMAGWKTEDMLQGIDGIMNLAAASGEDLATTSDIVTDALTAFGMSAKDSGHFADILAQASTNANTNVGMMGETFKYVAPVAGALGYRAEDVAVAIGLMANSSIKGSQAGTSLRSLLTRMAKPTDEVATAMDRLGVSLTDSSGKIKPFNSVIQDLRASFANLSEAEKAQLAASLAGQEGMSGLLAIVNASDEDFNKLTDAINNSEGAAKKMAETMQNNLKGQLTILKSSLEGLGIEIYESVKEPLTNIAKLGVETVNSLTDAFKSQGATGLVNALGDILAQMVTRAASQAPKIINLAVNIIQSFSQGIQKNAHQVVESLSSVLVSFTEGIASLIPTLGSLAITLVQELALAIVTQAPVLLNAGYEMLNNFINGFVDGIPTVLPKFFDFVQEIGENIATAAPVMIEKGFELLSKLAEGIVEAIPILIEKIPQLVTSLLNSLSSAISEGFPVILQKGVELIGQLLLGLIQAIPTLVANIPQIIQAIVDVFTAFSWIDLGKQIIGLLKDGIMEMLEPVKESARNVFEAIKTSIEKLPEKLKEIGSNAMSYLSDAINAGKEAATNAAENIFNSIKNAIKNLPTTLKEIGKTAVEHMSDAIKGAKDAVKDAAKAVYDKVIGVFEDLPDKMLDIGENLIKGLWNGISNMTDWVIGKIQGFGDSVLQGLKDFFGINSPSKVMEVEVGQWLAKGVGVGFEKYNPMVQIQKSLDVGLRGLESSLFGGVTNNNNQTNNFYGIDTPDRISRSLRMQQLYGMAGAR